METPKEYFDREYGTEHISEVIDQKDLVSMYGLIDEYAQYRVKILPISDVVKSLKCWDCGVMVEKPSEDLVECQCCGSEM